MMKLMWRWGVVGVALMAMGWLWWVRQPAAAAPAPPVLFVENVGQFDPAVRFRAEAGGHVYWFTEGAVYVDGERWEMPASSPITPFNPRPTVVSYYQGSRRFERVPVWGGIRYRGALPGLELAFGSQDGQLTRRWLRQGRAVTLAADRDPLTGWVEERESRAPVDWPFGFSTYLGGIYGDEGDGIGVGDDGSVYVGGTTTSLVFPEPDQAAHGVDVFLAKFLPDGSDLVYAIHFNPPSSAPDYGYALAVDGAGNAYLGGTTDSADFDVTPGAYDTSYGGGTDGFLLKVDADGSLVYSTFLGGSDFDAVLGVAIDGSGRAYVAGSTWSNDFIGTVIGPAANRSTFVARLNADGSNLERGVIMGGSGQDEATDLALDGDGLAYITGWSTSANLPTTPGSFSPDPNGGTWDAFVFKVDLNASSVVYGTYLGGGEEDRGAGIAVNSGGNVFVTGMSRSDDFPTSVSGYDTTLGGGVCDFAPCPDAFGVRLNAAGSALVYGTFIGGWGDDQGTDIALDSQNRVVITGKTQAEDFPVAGNGYDSSLDGLRDAFLAQLNSGGQTLLYGTYMGGGNIDEGQGVTIDAQGLVYLTGRTDSDDFPTTVGAYDTTHNSIEMDAIVVKMTLTDAPLPTPTATLMPTATPTTAVTSTPTHTATPGASPTPTSTATPTMAVTATPTQTATPGASPTSTLTPTPTATLSSTATATTAPPPTATATTAPPPTVTSTPTVTPEGGEWYVYMPAVFP